IELDRELAASLSRRFGPEKRIEVVSGDILETDLADLCRRSGVERCFVFGNVPYYITSPILRHLFDSYRSVRGMALVLQREVAGRLVAVPGTRAYGYLSVLARTYSEPRLRLGIPPRAFSPPPEVDSALVDFRLGAKFPDRSPSAELAFLGFVKRCFTH